MWCYDGGHHFIKLLSRFNMLTVTGIKYYTSQLFRFGLSILHKL